MDVTPNDLFLSVNDLFGVLLPGGMLLLLLAYTGDKHLLPRLTAVTDDKARWLAFLLAAYLLGHVIGLFSPSLQFVYDKTYRPVFGKNLRSYRSRAEDQAAVFLHGGYRRGDDVLLWARSVVELKNPQASADLDRVEANIRLFRGLAVVSFLAVSRCLWRRKWPQAGASFLLIVVCLFPFFDLQTTRETKTYQYFIALCTSPPVKPPAEAK